MKGYKNPINLIRTAKYRKKNKKKDFPYFGIDAYMGEFGSGKTLSAVKKVQEIVEKYPKTILITNTIIKNIDKNTEIHIFQNAQELIEILQEVLTEKNKNGYIIFMDEMHVVLSDLFGSSNPIFLTYLSQLRKLGIIIIGTCQLYNKCPKMVRDYLRLSGQIIFCHKLIPGLTLNRYVDMTTAQENSSLKLEYKLKNIDWYFHTIELYESYDTHAIVSQIKALINYDKNKNQLKEGEF